MKSGESANHQRVYCVFHLERFLCILFFLAMLTVAREAEAKNRFKGKSHGGSPGDFVIIFLRGAQANEAL